MEAPTGTKATASNRRSFRTLTDSRHAALEVSRRNVFETVMQGDVLSSPEHVRHYLSLHLTGLGHEVFSGVFLENRPQLIEYRELFSTSVCHGTTRHLR